jgi:hypothetical protein
MHSEHLFIHQDFHVVLLPKTKVKLVFTKMLRLEWIVVCWKRPMMRLFDQKRKYFVKFRCLFLVQTNYLFFKANEEKLDNMKSKIVCMKKDL